MGWDRDVEVRQLAEWGGTGWGGAGPEVTGWARETFVSLSTVLT